MAAAQATEPSWSYSSPPSSAQRIARDLEPIAVLAVVQDAAWEGGVASASELLAERTWPRGSTAEAVRLRGLCDPPPAPYSGPVDVAAGGELDAGGHGRLQLGGGEERVDEDRPTRRSLRSLAEVGLRP